MTYFKTDRRYRDTNLYKIGGNDKSNNSSNDLADLIAEKFRQLGIAIDLIKEKGHLEEYKKRIAVVVVVVGDPCPNVKGYIPT